MTKVTKLFDSSQGKSTRQIEIEKRYVEKGFDFEPIFRDALLITLKNPTPKQYRGRGFMANNMNWTVVGILKETYPEYMRVDEHQRDYFLLDKDIRVYFKKLDKKTCPNNIVTNNVRSLNTMQLLLNDNPVTVLYAGFRIREDKIWDDISGSFLVEMKNIRKPNWYSSLEDLAYEISKQRIQATPFFKAVIPDEIVVKTKKNNEEQLGKTGE